MAKSLPLIVLGATSAGTCLFVKSLSNLLIDLLAASLLFETASAATVSWIATGYVDDPGDVSTNGILAGALCVGAGTTAQTINGVPFNSDPGGNAPVSNGWLSFAFNYLNGTNATFWSGPDPGDSAAYNFALASARFGGVSVQVTISGLDAGNNYEIQIWAVDTRSNQSLRDRTGTFAAGNSVTLTYGGMLASTPGPQWALGTFTADSTSLTLTNVAEVPQLNLIQIRDTTPPPAAPSTAPFNILRATLTPPGELMLTWKSLSNAIYMVQGVDGLSAASWQTDLSNVVSQGAVTSVALPFLPTNSRRLLRVARDFSGAYYRVPSTNLNLVLAAPISTWDEGVPLGNGLLGGLLWGQTNLIRLSLDRGDLWDERPASGFTSNNFKYATMKSLVAAGSNDQFNAIFDSPYNDVHPTKIPAGRLEITLDPTQQLKLFELNLATAEVFPRLTLARRGYRSHAGQTGRGAASTAGPGCAGGHRVSDDTLVVNTLD